MDNFRTRSKLCTDGFAQYVPGRFSYYFHVITNPEGVGIRGNAPSRRAPIWSRPISVHHLGDRNFGGCLLDFGPPMQNSRLFEEIGTRISEVLANSPAKDIERNLRANLTSFLSRLDLVTREEFDVQSKVLERTREKLNRIEAQLAELEKKLSQ
jgi:BMFP domain-containing protein YqiC